MTSEGINACWLTLVGSVMQIDRENAKILGQLIRKTDSRIMGSTLGSGRLAIPKNVWVSTVSIRILYASSSEILQFLPGFARRFVVAMTMECWLGVCRPLSMM